MTQSRLLIQDNRIFYDLWRNIPATDLRDGTFKETLEQDFANNNLALSDLKNYTWIFDLKPEGISSTDIQLVYRYFLSHGVLPENFRVAFSCVEDITQLPYPSVCLPTRLIYNGNWYTHLYHYHIDWVNVPITHKLTCLMRRPSIGRGHLAKRLLSRFKPDELIMTFGTNGVDPSDDIKKLVWPQPYPMIVDRPMANQVFQHRIDHDLFYRAPVNLIVESSSQIDPGVWTSIFITEKTFKALAWYQFPIWYAVPGLVNEVRKLGFDVFDDLFDNHSYDEILEPWLRMTHVVMLVKKFTELDTVDLRKQYWNRLEKNAKLVEHIHTYALSDHTEKLNELIYGTF